MYIISHVSYQFIHVLTLTKECKKDKSKSLHSHVMNFNKYNLYKIIKSEIFW